ncbi:MAG: RHS repeat-associated core domain-containing protein, partial [Pseudomonadota bacterium]
GSSLGKKLVTSDLGKVSFSLPEKEYKVRADYLGQQYWSEIFNGDDETVAIEAGKVLLTISNMGHPLSNVKVYVFNSTGNYLGVNGLTDGEGQKAFLLPPGSYNFRADYLGTQFWSGVSTILSDIENPVTISTGGGNFALTVLKGDGTPLAGVKCSLFNASGSSNLHLIGTTTSDGVASFPLADGSYKIRIDYLGYPFWTEVFGIPQTNALTHTIAHQDVTISVNRNFAGDIEPGSGLKLYLFTPAGGYLGVQTVTDNLGRAVFSLPLQEYKVRANYLSEPYWSDSFLGTDKTIVINEGGADVQVAQGQTPLPNVPVYVFNDAGASLGINGRTTADGLAEFRLPEGTYKFRADYQKGQFWATEPILSHQDNIVDINTGGGAVTVKVEKAPGSPLTGVPVYVFSANGAYFGLSKQSSDQGAVSFDLSDGSYKFRVDYLGYSFWSNTISVPSTLSEVVTIAHQDVPITVESVYRTSATPLSGIRVYLFTEAGKYQDKSAYTNASGQAVFTLPAQSYKIRADYLGYQFWSDPFTQSAARVPIPLGRTALHVTKNGQNIVNAPVYLFKASGSSLGKTVKTDATGVAIFDLPEHDYKFRIDYQGAQHWSDVIIPLPDEETTIELKLDLLALNLTNNPNPVRVDENPPAFRTKGVLVASLDATSGILSQPDQTSSLTEKTYFFINDHLGTPLALTNEAGVKVWEADYLPFGEVHQESGSVPQGFRFPGQYFDSETGLHYNYHRYYDPKTGRYLTADPIGLVGGVNIYSYTQNNPVNFLDSWGLRPLTDIEKSYLTPYIPQRDLDNADVHVGEMPGYAPSWADGITRGNDVYFRDTNQTFNTPADLGLLGHELVHVGQYAEGMTWLSYLWANRSGYEKNPYEIDAYAMGAKIKAELKEKYGDPCPEK